MRPKFYQDIAAVQNSSLVRTVAAAIDCHTVALLVVGQVYLPWVVLPVQ